MSNFVVPNIFIPGTKAKATEVNENFAEIQDELNTKASKVGDETQTFKVANAVNNNQAVNKQQLENIAQNLITDSLNDYIVYTKYAINSGEFTNGIISYLTNNGTVIKLKNGTVYTDGSLTYTIEEDLSEDIASFEDGFYNIFIENGTDFEILPNKVTIDNEEPEDKTQDDYWLNIQEPLQAYVYDNYEWVKSEKTFLGSVIIENGIITKLNVGKLNQNGINLNAQTENYRLPDYSVIPETILANTVYYANEDCCIMLDVTGQRVTASAKIQICSDNAFGSNAIYIFNTGAGGGNNCFVTTPIYVPKGWYFKTDCARTNYKYPLMKRGV